MSTSSPELERRGVFRRAVDTAVLGFFALGTAANAAIFGIGVGIEVNEFAETQTLPLPEDLEVIGMSALSTAAFAGFTAMQIVNMRRRREPAAEHIS